MTPFEELMAAAYELALQSPDPSTQNGAIIFDPDANQILAEAWNDFPDKVKATPDRWERPTKYAFVEHAERRAIYEAARTGVRTEGLIMISPWASCADCARAIVCAGITGLVRHKQAMEFNHNYWDESVGRGDTILRESGIAIIELNHDFDNSAHVLRDGILWQP